MHDQASPPRRTRWQMRGLVALVGVALGIMLVPLVEPNVINSDWPAFATGGVLVIKDRDHLYDRSAQAAEQSRITGGAVLQAHDETGVLPFDMPPWIGMLNAPFAALPTNVGARLWTFLGLVALLVGFLLLAPPGRRADALPAFAGVPAALVALNAQVDGLVVLGIGAAMALRRSHREFGAGLALTLCLAKPQLVLPLAVALPLARQWRILAGWAAGVAALLGLTAIADVRWLTDWPSFLAAHAGRVGTELGPVGLVWLLGLPRPTAVAVAIVVVGGAIALVTWLATRLDRDAGLATVLVGGLLAAPHVLGADLVLVSAGLLAWGRARWWDWLAVSALGALAALLKGTAGTAVAGTALLGLALGRIQRAGAAAAGAL